MMMPMDGWIICTFHMFLFTFAIFHFRPFTAFCSAFSSHSCIPRRLAVTEGHFLLFGPLLFDPDDTHIIIIMIFLILKWFAPISRFY